jgi:hypothetical protein
MRLTILLITGYWLIVIGSSFLYKKETVNFPEGYREWHYVKGHLIGPKHPAAPRYSGFNAYYANDQALEGYKTDIWPDGSSVIVEVRESLEQDGNYAQGKVKFIDVMVKDSKKYASSGGWGFEKFMEADKTKPFLDDAGRNKCFSCHNGSAGERMVISTYKD